LRRQPSTGDDPVQVPRYALQVALPSATRARHQRVVRIAWERMQAFTQSRQARAVQLAIRCHCPAVAVCALDGHVLQPGLRFSHPFFWATSQAPPDDLGACSGITRRAAPLCTFQREARAATDTSTSSPPRSCSRTTTTCRIAIGGPCESPVPQRTSAFARQNRHSQVHGGLVYRAPVSAMAGLQP
jgi:hypothetical protein